MSKISLSGFTLAKGKELVGDDAFEIKTMENISVAILCDGVGSADEGQAAAKRTTKFLLNALKNRPLSWDMQKSITHFIENINNILYQESMESYERPEFITTVTVAVIEGNKLYAANVGDSRIYLLREGKLTQLSHDHASDEEGMENVLTAAVGIAPSIDIYYFENIIQKDDKILLCSDGLYNVLEEKTLKQKIPLGAPALVKFASKSVEDNLPDDTTAVMIDVKEPDQICILKQAKLHIPQKLKKEQIIDGYRLIQPLVQNERTWLCEQKGQHYVIKFAPIEAIDDERLLDLFVKEVWNAKRLKAGFFPKSVIPRNRTNRYYIMQMIEGDEVKKYLQKRLLSIDEGVNLALFLLKMEQFLLKFDLVHGDIKPENIIRAQRKGKTYYKMIDFGSIVEIFSLNSRAGTPSYLAPERFKGGSIDEKTEIFSIGVTLYETLSGKLPYGEIEPFQTPTFKEPKKLSKLNPKVPLWLENIIAKAIAPDESRRYQNYSEMIYELEHPEKVKAFYAKDTPILERNPILTCKIGFIMMLIINAILFFIIIA
jgi:serine/threonine protein phosphatase PrpC